MRVTLLLLLMIVDACDADGEPVMSSGMASAVLISYTLSVVYGSSLIAVPPNSAGPRSAYEALVCALT